MAKTEQMALLGPKDESLFNKKKSAGRDIRPTQQMTPAWATVDFQSWQERPERATFKSLENNKSTKSD